MTSIKDKSKMIMDLIKQENSSGTIQDNRSANESYAVSNYNSGVCTINNPRCDLSFGSPSKQMPKSKNS